MVEAVFSLDKSEVVTSNQSLHYQAKARKVAALRAKAAVEGLRLVREGGAFSTPVNARVVIVPPSRRRFDPPNAWPTVKPLIDGLVDAGLIADDDSTHVPVTCFERGEHSLAVSGRWLVSLFFTPYNEH